MRREDNRCTSLFQHLRLTLLMMNKGQKKTTDRILNHALQIIYLLTGEVLLLQHSTSTSMMKDMNKNKKITESILDHALEVIYLLTGEEYTIVKKNSPHSRIHQLTVEPEDAAVSLSMEVWEQTELRKEVMDGTRHSRKTLGIPAHKNSGLPHENVGIASEDEEDEIYEKVAQHGSIHSDLCTELDEKLYTVPVNEDEEYEIEERDIKQVELHSDSLEGPSNIEPSILSRLEPEEVPYVRGHKHVKQEDIPLNISEEGSMDRNTSEQHLRLDKDVARINHVTVHDNIQYNSISKYGIITMAKAFSCPYCGKYFNHKYHLNRHQRIHTGEKPFSCFECGKCFNQKISLTVHQRVHTGEKPFACVRCGKCFREKSKLDRHQKIHLV